MEKAIAVRPATGADAPDLAAILNAEILGGTASWKTRPRPASDMSAWLAAQAEAGRPVLVAELEGRVAGWASWGLFRAGGGYARTVEHSVYVAAWARRRGIARALMEALIARARAAGIARMVGAISADQPASLAFHRTLGFEEQGRLRGVGCKFGRALDLVLMVRAFDA